MDRLQIGRAANNLVFKFALALKQNLKDAARAFFIKNRLLGIQQGL